MFHLECGKRKIPYPTGISTREKEHMECCSLCQECWYIFYFFEHRRNTLSNLELTWVGLTESMRQTYYDKNHVRLKAVVQKRRRSLSSFNVFVRQHIQQYNAHPFGVRMKMLAAAWRQVRDRDSYKVKAVLKVHPYIQYLRRSKGKSRRKVEPNAFMRYLADRWADTQTQAGDTNITVGYRSVMQLAADEWNTEVSDGVKKQYRKRKDELYHTS
jgi:hypothetical protein